MPYKLSGTSVVKSDSGEVVKTHPTREKALAHLRALKANVEEGDMSGVLGALLEGFNPGEVRGWHGRWIRGRGGSAGRLEGSYNGIKLERGRAYQGKLATGEVFTGHWTGQVQGGVNGTEPLFKHVDDPSIVRTFAGGSGFGRLSDVKAAPSGAPSASPFNAVSGLGREGAAARERGASSLTSEHADTRDKLTNLPVGQTYGLHGPRGQVGHVTRTANGWEVQGGQGSTTSHKTPSSAAGAAMRMQRKAASSSQQADVMARNYRAGAEVRAMDARQATRAEHESKRQEQIAAMHGGFKVGDHVSYETGSRGAGGHGPVTFTQQPGVHEVVGLQRNGNLRVKHPVTGTTVDVHHSHAKRVRRAQESAPAPELLGALLEGARVQEAIGHIEKGAFHRWLGKKEGEPITDADIKRGLAAGGHPAKMAQFAKAARRFGK